MPFGQHDVGNLRPVFSRSCTLLTCRAAGGDDDASQDRWSASHYLLRKIPKGRDTRQIMTKVALTRPSNEGRPGCPNQAILLGPAKGFSLTHCHRQQEVYGSFSVVWHHMSASHFIVSRHAPTAVSPFMVVG